MAESGKILHQFMSNILFPPCQKGNIPTKSHKKKYIFSPSMEK